MTERERRDRLPVAATVLALLVLWPGCHRSAPEQGTAGGELPTAGRIQGCWGLAPGDRGAAADTVRRWQDEGVLPGMVRLDTARVAETDAGELYEARAYVRSREAPGLLTAWRPLPPDSIRVERPGALAGLQLRLGVGPEALRGIAVVFTDAVGPGETGRRTAPVEARPEACPR